MYKIKTRIDFEAAHRLYDTDTYSEECRENIHGHSYKLDIVLGVTTLNSSNMVVDFKLIKKYLREQIHSKYDHSCILYRTDPLIEPISANCKKVVIASSNPTAEWMAEEFYRMTDKILKSESFRAELGEVACPVRVCEVCVQETENNIAIYSKEV